MDIKCGALRESRDLLVKRKGGKSGGGKFMKKSWEGRGGASGSRTMPTTRRVSSGEAANHQRVLCNWPGRQLEN